MWWVDTQSAEGSGLRSKTVETPPKLPERNAQVCGIARRALSLSSGYPKSELAQIHFGRRQPGKLGKKRPQTVLEQSREIRRPHQHLLQLDARADARSFRGGVRNKAVEHAIGDLEPQTSTQR